MATQASDPTLRRKLLAGVTIDVNGCWLWTGTKTRLGYGQVRPPRSRKMVSVHRAAHEVFIGPIPDGHDVLHRCDHPACFRPAHLFSGTHAENMADMVAKGRSPVQPGERNPSAKLTKVQVVMIRARYGAGIATMAELGRTFGVHPSTIAFIVKRKKWTHI